MMKVAQRRASSVGISETAAKGTTVSGMREPATRRTNVHW
jgi:hypothetical protein